MATIEVSGPELLKAVQRLGPEEFDAFLEQALLLRRHAKADKLSPVESRLIKRINRGLPQSLSRRYAQLAHKRKAKTLSQDELAELLKLTHDVENLDAERAAALLELATLRQVPIRMLMRQMGIKAAPVHG
ncbi:MAG TPA: hypothetical protein VGH74_10060 [Planctomycetaceae bacterium]|jgi:hypothetical protein